MAKRICNIYDAVDRSSAIPTIAMVNVETALAAGYEVTVVAARLDPSLEGRVEWLPLDLPARSIALQWQMKRRRVRALLKGRRFDIVHVHQPQVADFGQVFQCHFLSRPAAAIGCLAQGRGLRAVLSGVQNRMICGWEDDALRRLPADVHVLFNSSLLKDEFERYYGQALSSQILPFPAPPFEPRSTADQQRARQALEFDAGTRIVVGYLGGVQRRKGFDRLVSAVAADQNLHLLAGGLYTDSFEPEEVAGRWTGLGVLDDVRPLLDASDVMVVPSRFEPFGLVAVESSMRGVPTIVTPEVGAGEALIANDAAMLWHPTEALGVVVQRAMETGVATTGVRRYADDYSESRYSQALLEIYASLTDRARTIHPVPELPPKEEGGSCVSTPRRLPDLIMFSLEPWDDIWRRNQFLCREMLRSDPRMRLLFVEPAADVSNAVRTGKFGRLATFGLRQIEDYPGISAFRPVKWLPNSVGSCRRMNRRMLAKQVLAAAERLGLSRPLLWINDVQYVNMLRMRPDLASVYDVTDDWTLIDEDSEQQRELVEHDIELTREADLTVVCSESLTQSRGVRARELMLVPNGVDIEHYLSVDTVKRRDGTHDGRVFGYTGTLHDERVDVSLVVHLAEANPRDEVRLVGPNCLGVDSRRRLAACPNVKLVPPVPYRDVPLEMSRFDVCIVPHRVTPFTESLNPIKLWEYLAAGLPIVSTPVSGFRDYPALCRITDTPEQFSAACIAAAAEGDSMTAARRGEAAKHGWSRRFDQLSPRLGQLGQAHAVDKVQPPQLIMPVEAVV
jgi:glycosyltransferase involved in cell wall biosynthesis